MDFVDLKHGACAGCHSGPMLNETNLFGELAFGVPKGTRFQTILVSELNAAGNPVHDFIFNEGLPNERRVSSPTRRSLITGVTDVEDTTFSNFNSTALQVCNTILRFHDNSAKTLEDVLAHYKTFFEIATNGAVILTPRDQKDIVAFLSCSISVLLQSLWANDVTAELARIAENSEFSSAAQRLATGPFALTARTIELDEDESRRKTT